MSQTSGDISRRIENPCPPITFRRLLRIQPQSYRSSGTSSTHYQIPPIDVESADKYLALYVTRYFSLPDVYDTSSLTLATISLSPSSLIPVPLPNQRFLLLRVWLYLTPDAIVL